MIILSKYPRKRLVHIVRFNFNLSLDQGLKSIIMMACQQVEFFTDPSGIEGSTKFPGCVRPNSSIVHPNIESSLVLRLYSRPNISILIPKTSDVRKKDVHSRPAKITPEMIAPLFDQRFNSIA